MRTMPDNIVPFPEGASNRLEDVEMLCLTYLRRSKDPVVSVKALYEHCNRELASMPLREVDFMDFLRNHAEVLVMDGLAADSPLQRDLFDVAGMDLGARAIVRERVPTKTEMVQMMGGQLRDMLKALETVRERAVRDDDAARIAAIDAAATRARQLQETIKYLG